MDRLISYDRCVKGPIVDVLCMTFDQGAWADDPSIRINVYQILQVKWP